MVDVDDLRQTIKTLMLNCFVNGAFDVDSAAQLIAEYVVEMPQDKDEIGFGWWEDDD